MPSLREAAIWYAEHDIAIVPLRPRTKEPYANEGVYVASRDVAIVTEWWDRRPAANIAIPMGPVNQLLGLDCDSLYGAPVHRWDLRELYGEWDDTAEVESGREGGRHIYFEWPKGITTLPKEIAPGLQLRGEGLYMVAPPSTHPNGNLYTFDGEKGKESLLHPAPAPEWLLEMIHESLNGHSTHTLEHYRQVIEAAQPEPWLRSLPEEFLLAKAMEDTKFRQLFEGIQEGYESHSEADEALVCKAIFWFGHNVPVIDKIYRRSRLMRAKWDRKDYWTRTMGSSFEKQTKVYEPMYNSSSASNGSSGAATGAAPVREKEKKDKEKATFTWEMVPPVWDLEAHVSWVVEDMIPEGSITLLTGDSGHGKTMFTTALCGHIVTGKPFLDREVRQRPVLYLDRENPLGLVKQHLYDLHIDRNVDFRIWGEWCEMPPDGPSSPCLMEYAKRVKGVMVFDSLIAFHTGNEQDASETRRYLQQFRALAAAGATIILLHHTGKAEGSKKYRGSSDIKASVDMAILISKEGEEAGLIDEMKLMPFKNRMGSFNAMRVKLEDGTFTPDSPVETKEDVVFRLIRMYPGSGIRDLLRLGKPFEVTRHTLDKVLQKGLAQGKLEIQPGLQGRTGYYCPEVTLGEL